MGVYKEIAIEREDLETELTSALKRLASHDLDTDEASQLRARVKAIYIRLESLSFTK